MLGAAAGRRRCACGWPTAPSASPRRASSSCDVVRRLGQRPGPGAARGALGPAPHAAPLRHRPRCRRCWSGLALRLAVIASPLGEIDGDEAVVGLMARHIAFLGELPVFYWGQPYLGSLEAFTAAPLFRRVRLEHVAAQTGADGVQPWLSGRQLVLARRLFGTARGAGHRRRTWLCRPRCGPCGAPKRAAATPRCSSSGEALLLVTLVLGRVRPVAAGLRCWGRARRARLLDAPAGDRLPACRRRSTLLAGESRGGRAAPVAQPGCWRSSAALVGMAAADRRECRRRLSHPRPPCCSRPICPSTCPPVRALLSRRRAGPAGPRPADHLADDVRPRLAARDPAGHLCGRSAPSSVG